MPLHLSKEAEEYREAAHDWQRKWKETDDKLQALLSSPVDPYALWADYKGKKILPANNIGFLQFTDGKQTMCEGVHVVHDFYATDTNRARQGMLRLKKHPGIFVYSKQNTTWHAINRRFTDLRETITYWNHPWIVIIEYVFTK